MNDKHMVSEWERRRRDFFGERERLEERKLVMFK